MMRIKFSFLLVTLPLCALAVNLFSAEVAKVGNASITSEVLQQTVARQGYNLADEASARKGLEDAVRFELLAAEAKKMGLESDPTIARQIKELLVQRLVMEKIDKPLASFHATPDEVQAYFAVHTNEFRRPALARGTVITLFITQGNEAEAQSKAAMALQELKTSLKPEDVVHAYSDDPGEKVNGGMSNFFIEGETSRRYPQAVAEAMLGLKMRGDTAGPIASPRAVYVLKLAERRDAQPMPYEQVKAEIYKRLQHEQREKLLADFCEQLKKEFPVTVDETQFKAAFPQPTGQGSPPPAPFNSP